MPNNNAKATPESNAERGGFVLSRRQAMTAALSIPASLAITSIAGASPASAAPQLTESKASSVKEDFAGRPSNAYWGTGGNQTLVFPGDSRMHMGSHAELWTKDTYDFTEDTISTEVVSVDRGMWGLVGGPQWRGGYYFTIMGGELWCNCISSNGWQDIDFTKVPYDSTAHRFLFLTHHEGKVLFQSAPSYEAPRTTLRTAQVTDLGTTSLRIQYLNKSDVGATFSNLNGYFVAPMPLVRPEARVDFGRESSQIAPGYLGFGCTGLGNVISKSPAQALAERTLDARQVRLMVHWDGQRTVNGAGGAWPWPSKPIVDQYRSWGYSLLIVIAGRDGDFAGYVDGDAARIVSELGTDQIQYSGPNEADQHGVSYDMLVARNQQLFNEIQSVAPGTRLWGPSISHYGRDELFNQYLLKLPSDVVAGCDYHSYPMWDPYLPTNELYESTPAIGDQVRRTLDDMRANNLPAQVMVSELNLTAFPADDLPESEGGFSSPDADKRVDGRLFSAVETVWMTSAIGHILTAGGMVLPYASQGTALGIFAFNEGLGQTDRVPGLGHIPDASPLASYWAIAMFTGAGDPKSSTPEAPARNYPHFKDRTYEVQLSGISGSTELFAFNNEAGGYNLVAVNKGSQAESLTVALSSVAAGTLDVWQSDPAHPVAPPRQITKGQGYDADFRLDLPSGTVTAVILSPGQA